MSTRESADMVNIATNGVARRSRSRKLLLRLLALQPGVARAVWAARLGVTQSSFDDYEQGRRLMPLDVQDRLALFVIAHEPRVSPLARLLRIQVQAARRYEAAEVVRHLTCPP
jgi:hypothetical protein